MSATVTNLNSQNATLIEKNNSCIVHDGCDSCSLDYVGVADFDFSSVLCR